MNESLTWLSVAGFVLAGLALLASVGFRRFVVALVAATIIAASSAALVGWLVFAAYSSLVPRGGEWGALAALGTAFITTVVVFVLVFLLTIILLAFSKRAIFRRSAWSLSLFALSVVCAAIAVGSYVFNSPGTASTKSLLANMGKSGMDVEIENELVRRGAAALPAVLAESRRWRQQPVGAEELFVVERLQKTLGRIGGEDAIAELRLWLASGDAVVYVRTSAATALAAAGDRDSIPNIAAFFSELAPDRDLARPVLLKALGQLKAVDHVPLIREAVTARPAITPGEMQTIEVGVTALATIDSDEAWQAIAELCQDADLLRRQTVIRALQATPCARTFTQLVVALEDNDATVREAAYWSLLRVDPKLFEAAPPPWNAATEEKIRQAVKGLPTKP